MITRFEEFLYVVVNAGCKHADLAHLTATLAGVTITARFDRALLALQGPEAAAVMAELSPDAAGLGFMSGRATTVAGVSAIVTRSGYTGEDGFEISIAARDAEAVARTLLADSRVKPIGLGARDSLRLEAGLCLYGHDIDTTTSPIEAGLTWTISKRRRAEGGFPGAERIQRELAAGPARVRVGIRPEDKAPAREGTAIVSPSGEALGTITSGGFGPTVGGPIAMGYVRAGHAGAGTEVHLMVRGSPRPARVVPMPFAPHRYHRG
jgi:aminomethyltransferase